MTVGQRIKETREALGLSQDDLALKFSKYDKATRVYLQRFATKYNKLSKANTKQVGNTEFFFAQTTSLLR